MPSLSVVQTVPSRRKKDAPALSSPPKPRLPSKGPSTNHLKPTGTSITCRPISRPTRSIMLLLTRVLPMEARTGPVGPVLEEIPDGNREVVIGFH